MVDVIKNFLPSVSALDFIYFILTILSVLSCYKKGFVLSVLSIAKWLIAYVITLILFPKIKPHVSDIVDNEYIVNVSLSIGIFITVFFLVLIIGVSISKTIKYAGIGILDTTLGFLFGFIKAYIISTCIFLAIHTVYNYDKWPINLNKSYVFPYLKKGSNYLIKEFPNEKIYQKSKEKIKEL